MKKVRNNQLTLEQIATTYGITTNDVSDTIDIAYNKMVQGIMMKLECDIWDAVVIVKGYLGMTEIESVDKLSKENRRKLELAAQERFS